MFSSSTKVPDSSSSETLLSQFQRARKDTTGIALIAFFKMLYKTTELRPCWDELYKNIKGSHAEENLDFFKAYLRFLAEPTKEAWVKLYADWIDMKGIEIHDKINIVDALRKHVQSLHEQILASEGDHIRLTKLKVKVNSGNALPERTMTGREIIDSVAAAVLGLLSSDPYHANGIVAAFESHDATVSKSKEPSEKKEKKEEKKEEKKKEKKEEKKKEKKDDDEQKPTSRKPKGGW